MLDLAAILPGRAQGPGRGAATHAFGTHYFIGASLDYSRTMKEKSHRVSRRCYRSGVDALRGTQTRRLDGHTLYSASHVQIRAERQAAGRRLRPAARQLRWWGDPAQGDRHPV